MAVSLTEQNSMAAFSRYYDLNAELYDGQWKEKPISNQVSETSSRAMSTQGCEAFLRLQLQASVLPYGVTVGRRKVATLEPPD